jgi:hypothetical protein
MRFAGDLTIHSDAQAAIARVSHTGTEPRQDRAIRVVKAVQKLKERGWRTSIEWVLGQSGISANEQYRPTRWGSSSREENWANLNRLGSKKEFPNITLWPRSPKLNGETT